MNEGYAKKPAPRAAVWPVIRALWRVVRRDLGSFGSIVANNFFLFVALLVYSAAVSGVKPVSAYPFLGLLAFLILFPLAADPLAKIPAVRLGLWPLGRSQRLGLRTAALALSPMVWLLALLALRVSRPAAALGMVAVPLVSHGLATPRWKPLRHVPAIGELMRKNLRQMLSVLDPYLAALIAIIAVAGHVRALPGGAAGMAMLVALAFSTYAQCLFGLDGASGAARYRLLPIAPWRILLAKDAAYLMLLLVLVLPVDAASGLTFGFLALAAGRYPSLRYRIPVVRWRFTSGRVAFGVLQIVAGSVASLAEGEHGWPILALAAAAWLVSLGLGGWWFGRSAVRQ